MGKRDTNPESLPEERSRKKKKIKRLGTSNTKIEEFGKIQHIDHQQLQIRTSRPSKSRKIKVQNHSEY
ncbi:hypothetical protein HYE29_01500 [Mycoplasmopsis bovis]|nr:hypothetical protein [Mycoplasmopsis bovis]QQH22763.1 hypothetical protein HYE29_01500 [Mycoplasmopsis bovis]